MDNLGYIDLILLAVIVFVAVRGFFSGFIRELFGLLGMTLGVIFASRYAYSYGEWIRERVFDFNSPTLNTFVGFVAIFLIIWFFALCFSWLISRLTKTTFPKYLNGILGGLFGALKAFVALAILLHFVFKVDFMSGVMKHFEQNSILYPSMQSIASSTIKAEIVEHIPKDSQEVKEKVLELKDQALEGAKNLGDEIQKDVTIEQGQ